MKIMTLFGTRPEIIRLSQVIKQLDRFCEQMSGRIPARTTIRI